MNIFNGFTLPYPNIPKGWKWMNRAVPTTWMLYALSASQLGDNEQPFIDPNGKLTTVKGYLLDNLGYRHDFIWYQALVHVTNNELLVLIIARVCTYMRE